VVLIPEQHLVALFELEPVVDGVVGLTRVADESDFVRAHPHLLSDFFTGLFAQLAELRPVLEAAVVVHIGGEPADPIRHRARRRTQVGRVHGHFVLVEGKLCPDEMPVAFAVDGRLGEALAPSGALEGDRQQGRPRSNFFQK